MQQSITLIIVGVLAGMLGGLVGIGGGIIIVPALVYIFGLSQHKAQGTTLALLVPPIGILAAIEYYRRGDVDLRMALLLCVGFVVGSYLGARFAGTLSNDALRRVFGVVMLVMSLKLILTK